MYIIDDEGMVRRSLFVSLCNCGFELRSFQSGSDFLDEVDSLESGCILLDRRMPETDGVKVLAGLGHRARRWPVIIMTGHGGVDIAVRMMKMGLPFFWKSPSRTPGSSRCSRRSLCACRLQADAEGAEARARIARLTPREGEVLQGLVAGLSNKAAAIRSGISHRTIEIHRANLMETLGIGSAGEAVHLALLAGPAPLGLAQAPDELWCEHARAQINLGRGDKAGLRTIHETMEMVLCKADGHESIR